MAAKVLVNVKNMLSNSCKINEESAVSGEMSREKGERHREIRAFVHATHNGRHTICAFEKMTRKIYIISEKHHQNLDQSAKERQKVQ